MQWLYHYLILDMSYLQYKFKILQLFWSSSLEICLVFQRPSKNYEKNNFFLDMKIQKFFY